MRYIEYAGPNERDRRDPHVWFVIARVWLPGQERYQYPGGCHPCCIFQDLDEESSGER